MATQEPNRTDTVWETLAEEFKEQLSIFEYHEKLLKEKKQALYDEFDENIGTNVGFGVMVTKAERKGSIAYTKAIKELGLDSALFEPFRGESTTVMSVKQVVEKDE